MPAIDPNQENAALLMAIHQIVAGDSPEARSTLYQTLMSSNLYLVSLSDEEGDGPLELKQGAQLQLAMIPAPNGKTYMPAFSDVARVKAALPPKGRYLPVAAPMLCGMFMQGDAEGIVINPGHPPSGLITRPEVTILASGGIPQVGPDGQITGQMPQQIQIRIQKPATPPEEAFIDAIKQAASGISDIEEVHIFAAGIENQPIKLVIGMLMREDMEPPQMQPAFEVVGKAAMDAKGNMEEFDMMPLSKDVVEAITPQVNGLIYKKA